MHMGDSNIELITAARLIADFAIEEGVFVVQKKSRYTSDHLGAILADTILQAGLNYKAVVQPRIQRILEFFPNADRKSRIINIVKSNSTACFLNWNHPEKINRFEQLVYFMDEHEIEDVVDLKRQMQTESFNMHLQKINGIGPKSVDYLACLVGIDSIAVDRHIVAYARRVGIESNNYYFLRSSFSYAADLLSMARRDFDSWVWEKQSSNSQNQQIVAA